MLLLALTGLLLVPLLVRHWLAPTAPPAVSADEVRALDQLASQLERAETQRRRAWSDRPARGEDDQARAGWTSSAAGAARRPRGSFADEPAPVIVPLTRLTPFDPNALSAVDWQRRGVPADVARRLVSYGRKAGGYRYREQLQRIYGLSPILYERLAPYLLLASRSGPTTPAAGNAMAQPGRRPGRDEPAPASAPVAAVQPTGFSANSPVSAATPGRTGYTRKLAVVPAFDVNTADTTFWQQVRGIGRKRAARIVALREQLGGFVAVEQLAEVWGLEGALLDTLLRCGRVEAGFRPQGLALNSASEEELRRHPYVGYRLAKGLVAYRQQHGPFGRVEELRQLKLIDEAAYQKLLPYAALK